MSARRNRQIVAARKQGLTLREIAERFGVTRERIRQLCVLGGLVGTRSETFVNDAEIAPYMKLIDSRFCVVCGGDRPESFKYCADCAAFIDLVRTIKSRLRSARDNNAGYQKNIALYLIRKNRIKPEDLELV